MGDNPHHAILSEKLLHPRKAKRQRFHPYRLTFIFCQRRRHGCRRAFSLPEFVRRIAPPMQTILTSQTYPESCCIHEKQSGRASTIPLDVYFSPTQTTRLSLPEFVHRIAPPVQTILANLSGKLLHPRKAKRQRFHPYRLMFIFCQRRRHGCHRAFSLPESVHRIAPPMRTHEK